MLSKNSVKALYQLLYDTDRILSFANINYWLTAGSLLGCIRNGGLIVGDSDVDICIENKNSKKLVELEPQFSKCGYRMEKGGNGYVIYKGMLHIDIYVVVHSRKNQMYRPYLKSVRDRKPEDYFYDDQVFPLKRVAFGGFLAFIPQHYDDYLERNYGYDWDTVDKHGNELSEKKLEPAKPMKISQRKCLPVFRDPVGSGTSPVNDYFDRVFVINLHDYRDRLAKIGKRLKSKGIQYTLFDAVDGRCKDGDVMCDRKRRAFELEYNVKVSEDEDVPPLSLTLGTWFLLKQQVKNRWKRILIFEDDATLVRNFNKRFEEGVEELNKVGKNWDLLYLGCTEYCGSRGVSKERTSKNKHLTSIAKFSDNANFYVKHKDDIRHPCSEENCKQLSENISIAARPGGNFGYAISLKGAKKILKFMDNTIDDHIDGLIGYVIDEGNMKVLSFDPPIVNHYGGADRADTAIDWAWS